jgi:hypothetical protein
MAMRGEHGLMNRQTVLLNIAVTATLLVQLAQSDSLALPPAGIGVPRAVRHPAGGRGIHQMQEVAGNSLLQRLSCLLQRVLEQIGSQIAHRAPFFIATRNQLVVSVV